MVIPSFNLTKIPIFTFKLTFGRRVYTPCSGKTGQKGPDVRTKGLPSTFAHCRELA